MRGGCSFVWVVVVVVVVMMVVMMVSVYSECVVVKRGAMTD